MRGPVAVTVWLIAAWLLATAPATAQGTAPAPGGGFVVAGWVERIGLPEHGLELDAKLDTGADTSSIDARDMVRLRKDGVSSVRFTIVSADGRQARIEAPVVRRARIKRAGGASDSRLVVRLRLCLAGQAIEAEVTLADRSQLSMPMLVGRNVLAGRVLVDAGAERRTEAACQ